MRSIVTGLFGRKQSVVHHGSRYVRPVWKTRAARFHTLGLQSLEDRLALALTVNAVTLTTPTAPPTFAYVIAIDDDPNPVTGGDGTHLYMQSSNDGTSYFLIDNDPSFSNAIRLPRTSGLGACTTVLVISSDAPTNLPGGNPAGDLPAARGPTSGALSHAFTFQASTTVPNERLIVDLSPVGSRISIESPWTASRGDDSGTTPGGDVDWPAYLNYGGNRAVGQVALFATQVNIASNTSSTSRFTADGASLATAPTNNRLSGFTAPVQTVTINAAVNADHTRIRVVGDATPTPTEPGLLSVSAAGSFTSSTMTATALGANIQFEGKVTAAIQTYQLNAMPGLATDPRAYTFSTRSQSTGVQSGTIVSSGSIGITMGNPAGGTVDLRTDASRIAFQSGSSNGVPYRYDVAITEDDNLQIDSVGSSSGPIAFKTGGSLTILGDAIRTTGDLLFAATGSLTLSGSVNSSNGDIQLESNTLSLGSDVVAGGGKSVSLRSTTGATTTNALVRAGGPVKQSVVATSERNYALTGLGATPVIDTVTLVNNDRVLLKNQTDPKENGIYVFSTAGGGVLTRATDADSSAEMPSGFVVFALGGTQEGAWAFRNPNAPQFVGSVNQTALSFVPATATQVYADVRLATTAADGNQSLSGTTGTIDGQTLTAGDRVLVKNQSNAAENGIYVVSTGTWDRASDADSTSELRAGSYVFVTGGATLSGTGWALLNDAIQVGVTNLTFTPFTQQPPSALAPWAPAEILGNARVATTTNIALTGIQTIDGVALTVGNVVLVKNQTLATQNGLYTVAAGAWVPVGGMPPPRGASVYVLSGVKNGGTAWQFNDSSSRLAMLTLSSPTVTGLVSTEGLAVGMLVTGAGIPSGTTITSVGSDGTTLQLSANALLSSTNAPLTFTATTSVTGTTPIVFVPVAGAVTVTAATNIGGSSSLQGATALLTAGLAGGATSTITAQTKVGRIAASAPAAIAITSANAVELEQVRTTSAGKVTVSADGTLTALNVSTKGTAGTPGSVSLTATSGDVVAESVTTNLGDISLASVNDSIFITKARLQSANVSTTVGNVTLTTNRPSATPAPVIRIDGRVSAQGTGGIGDITLTSSYGQAQFTGNAVVAAADTLKIDTRSSVVSISDTPQIAAAALDLTSQFGGSDSYDPKLGSYQIVTLNRTDPGDIDVASSGSLTIQGATTVNDPLNPTKGSIKFQAPDITVKGPIQPGGSATDIVLNATAGDLKIDTTLTAPRAITLQSTGKISASGGTATPLLTAGGTLTIVANSAATVLTKVSSLNATLSGAGAVLDVTEADNLTIDQISTPAGGLATVTAGTPSAGGSVTVKTATMGPGGSIKIVAYQDILEDGDALLADIVANRAELIATTGHIDVDTDVTILLASAAQKNQTITVDDLGTSASTPLELQSVLTNNADITITAKRSILATSVTTAGKINLTTFDAGADILAGSLSALGNTISLTARGSILEATPTDPTADISATTVSLTATDGSIDVHLAASAVAATATAAGSSITITDDDDLAIGDAATGISGNTVTIMVGGGLTQTKAVMAQSVGITSTAGDVLLTNASNDFDVLSVATASKSISVVDVDDLSVASLAGNLVSLAVGGTLTQTGGVSAFLLAVTSSAGVITLTDASNSVSWLTIDNGNRPVAFTNSGVLGIGGSGITGGNTGGGIGVDIQATTIGVNSPITSGAIGPGNGDIRLTATTGDIWLPQPTSILTAKDDTITLDASNGSIYQTAGAIDCKTLVWFAKTAPAFLGNPPNTYSIVSPNLTGGGDITIIQPGVGTITVAGASTADGNITILGDDVVITGLLQTNGVDKSVSVTATLGSIAFQSAGQAVNALGRVSLSAVNGAVTAANMASLTTVAADSLALVALSNSSLKTAVALISGETAGNLSLTEADGIAISGLTGDVISLATGGDVTQTAAIKGSLLAITNTAGAITLTNATNDVTWLTVNNGNRPVAYTDATSLGIGGSGVTGGNTAGGIGVDIRAAVIGVNTPITSGGAGAGDGDVRLTATAGNIWLSASVTAKDDAVILDASNATIIQQAGILDCQTLVWYAASQPTLFGTPPNTYTVIAPNLTAGGNIVIGPVAGPLTVAGASTSNGNITITGGSIVITGLVQTNGTGKSIVVTATSGGITFQNGGQIANALGSVSLTAAGPVAIGTVTAGTTVTITTSAGGGVDVGPLPNGLLKAGGTLDLRNVQGTIGIRNGGRIEGSPVLLPAGKGIQVGGSVTTAAGLNQTVATINALPVIPGSRYEILVAANISLTQTLTVSRPLALRGTSQAITLFGSAAVRNGLLLDATAGNSRVSDLTFAGFADDAIRLTNNTNSALTGLRIRDSGYGLTVTGTSTGTVAQGNVFNRNATGVRLLSATGVLIGGYAAGQGNTIQNAAREGVFAQGFCTGSQVIRNTITGTAVPYNTTQSRNLTVVR